MMEMMHMMQVTSPTLLDGGTMFAHNQDLALQVLAIPWLICLQRYLT